MRSVKQRARNAYDQNRQTLNVFDIVSELFVVENNQVIFNQVITYNKDKMTQQVSYGYTLLTRLPKVYFHMSKETGQRAI